MKRSEIAFGLLRIPVDFAMVVLGFYLGYKIRLHGDFIPGFYFPLDLASFPPVNEYFQLTLFFGAMLVLLFGAFGLYQLKNTEGPLRESTRVAVHSLIWILLIIAYFFVVRQVFFSRLVLGLSFLIVVLFLISARLLLHAFERLLLHYGIGQRRVLIIGSSRLNEKILKQLKKDPHYVLAGFLEETNLEELEHVIREKRVEEIIQSSQKIGQMDSRELVEYCLERHLAYHFVPDLLDIDRTRSEISSLSGLPLIRLTPTPLEGWGKILKRSLDLLGASVGLLALSPLFLLIAIGIKVDSPGPILFIKIDDGSPALRVGQKGKLFKFYKFRTMKAKSHDLRSELAENNHRKGPLIKIKNDPRITRFGRFLRRLSLDELPQLWNVLKGDMSLVGPRPHLPEEVADYEKHHKFLLTLKPGITGLSQVNGRSDLDFEEEVRLDTTYITHWSPLLDFKILLKTAWVVLHGKAAD